jgi:hypothetical protein
LRSLVSVGVGHSFIIFVVVGVHSFVFVGECSFSNERIVENAIIIVVGRIGVKRGNGVKICFVGTIVAGGNGVKICFVGFICFVGTTSEGAGCYTHIYMLQKWTKMSRFSTM